MRNKEIAISFDVAINSAVFELMNKRLEELAHLEQIVLRLAAENIENTPGWKHKDIEASEAEAQKIIHDAQDTIYGLWTDTSYSKHFERTAAAYFCDDLYGEES